MKETKARTSGAKCFQPKRKRRNSSKFHVSINCETSFALRSTKTANVNLFNSYLRRSIPSVNISKQTVTFIAFLCKFFFIHKDSLTLIVDLFLSTLKRKNVKVFSRVNNDVDATNVWLTRFNILKGRCHPFVPLKLRLAEKFNFSCETLKLKSKIPSSLMNHASLVSQKNSFKIRNDEYYKRVTQSEVFLMMKLWARKMFLFRLKRQAAELSWYCKKKDSRFKSTLIWEEFSLSKKINKIFSCNDISFMCPLAT